MTKPKSNRHLGLSIPEFNQNWNQAYRFIARRRGIKKWWGAARLYDYLLYRAFGATRFKLPPLSNTLVMKHSGLNPNTMKPAREFLIGQGLVTASPENVKGERWTFEILNPQTFQPFLSEWNTSDPAVVDASGTLVVMADHFANEAWGTLGLNDPEFRVPRRPRAKPVRTAHES